MRGPINRGRLDLDNGSLVARQDFNRHRNHAYNLFTEGLSGISERCYDEDIGAAQLWFDSSSPKAFWQATSLARCIA